MHKEQEAHGTHVIKENMNKGLEVVAEKMISGTLVDWVDNKVLILPLGPPEFTKTEVFGPSRKSREPSLVA